MRSFICLRTRSIIWRDSAKRALAKPRRLWHLVNDSLLISLHIESSSSSLDELLLLLLLLLLSSSSSLQIREIFFLKNTIFFFLK